MEELSELTIKEVWPHLCALGICEVRINNRTVWSDFALDVLAGKEYYSQACREYLGCAEEDLLGEWYENFRITSIDIKVVDFHHCIAAIEGYYEDMDEEGE